MNLPTFFLLASFLKLISCTNNTTISQKMIANCNFFFIPPTENLTFLHCSTPTTPNEANWAQCIDSCCKDMQGWMYPLPSFSTLTLCARKWERQSEDDAFIMIIGLSVAAVFIFLGLAIATYKILSFICNNQVAHAEDVDSVISESSINREINQIQWRRSQDKAVIQIDKICSICLQDSCYAKLSCTHLYHPQCIGEWFQKSNFCPNCNGHDIKKIKQYCFQCHSYFFIIRKQSFLKKLNELKMLICRNCKSGEKDNEEEGRVTTNWRCEDNKKLEQSTQNVLNGL